LFIVGQNNHSVFEAGTVIVQFPTILFACSFLFVCVLWSSQLLGAVRYRVFVWLWCGDY